MKKGVIYAIVAIALAAVLIFSAYKLTGQATNAVDRGECADSDNGLNYNVAGTAKYANDDAETAKKYTDYCFSRTYGPKKWVNEYYCKDSFTIGSRKHKCESNVCENGACAK